MRRRWEPQRPRKQNLKAAAFIQVPPLPMSQPSLLSNMLARSEGSSNYDLETAVAQL